MKLLVVSHPCCEAAINQQFYAHIAALAGWDVTIVLPTSWMTDYGMRRAQRWRGFSGKLIALPVSVNGNVPLHFYRARLARILAGERPDVVFVQHEPYGVATFQTFLANQRSVRAPIGFYGFQNLVKHYPWPFAAMERYVYDHARFALPVTSAAAQVMQIKGYRGPMAVLPLGVDTDIYRPASPGSEQEPTARSELVVGFLGRLVAEKGVETLLEALAMLQTTGIRAVIAGAGPLADHLRSLAEARGLGSTVSWAGYVEHDRTPEFYRSVDVLVVPSEAKPNIKEQFGRVVVEALACAVPVVTSDCGELPQLVEMTGGGWVFPQRDPAALAAILRSLFDQRQMLRQAGIQGRARVVQQLGMEGVAEAFVGAVEGAVKRRRAA